MLINAHINFKIIPLNDELFIILYNLLVRKRIYKSFLTNFFQICNVKLRSK